MLFTVKCAQCMMTNVLRDRQYMFDVRSLLVTEKVLMTRNNLARPHTARVTGDCGQPGVRGVNVITSTIQPAFSTQSRSSFWPDEENAGWTEICLRYAAMGHLLVACAAADPVFFASGIHRLVERWNKCLSKLGGYVEK